MHPYNVCTYSLTYYLFDQTFDVFVCVVFVFAIVFVFAEFRLQYVPYGILYMDYFAQELFRIYMKNLFMSIFANGVYLLELEMLIYTFVHDLKISRLIDLFDCRITDQLFTVLNSFNGIRSFNCDTANNWHTDFFVTKETYTYLTN